MDLPVVQARKLVERNNLTWVDNVYQGSVPEDVVNDTSKTDIAISEYINEPARYANSRFKGWEIGVEVQIFYAESTKINIQDAEITFLRIFESDGWSVDQSKHHSKDPDTGQVSKVFYFTKKFNLKEGF